MLICCMINCLTIDVEERTFLGVIKLNLSVSIWQETFCSCDKVFHGQTGPVWIKEKFPEEHVGRLWEFWHDKQADGGYLSR